MSHMKDVKLESLTRPDDLRTSAFKYRRNNPCSVSHDTAAMYLELCADRIERLVKQREELLEVLNRITTLSTNEIRDVLLHKSTKHEET